MKEILNVESFNLDHTKVVAPYIRLASTIKGDYGDIIYKFDIRFMQPNQAHLAMPTLHSLEHLIAELSRNFFANIIDFSPMGCQTGFYFTLLNENNILTVKNILEKTFYAILLANKVPGCSIEQCGWAANHDLAGAKEASRHMLAKIDEWTSVYSKRAN